MKNLLYYFFLLLLLSGMWYACSDSEDDLYADDGDSETESSEEEDSGEESGTVDAATLAINRWIWENMDELYYWNDQVPDTIGLDLKQEEDPEAYFYKLLVEEDIFSWITDDYASLQAGYEGEPVAMGYDPTFYTFGNAPDQVFMVVNYVYPGSGAETAGLRRGNVILEINGEELTTDNYYELYSGSSYTVSLGSITLEDDVYSIGLSGTTLSLTSSIPDTEPIIFSGVIDTLGLNIGYMNYAEFLVGSDDKFLESMDEVFAGFRSAGISDMIVDLRYNPGGDVDAAVHLASLIAPSGNVSGKDVLVNLEFNADYQAYLERNLPNELYYTFDASVSENLNLNSIYFLTTAGTASASELVITGLDPYMNVVQVGEATYGKYYGAYVLPDEKEEWAMLPIVMKYSNAAGYTDFEDGLEPDYESYDDFVVDDALYNDRLIYLYPLGNPSDLMTKTAIELIAGTYSTPAVASRSVSDKAGFRRMVLCGRTAELRRTLLVPAPEILKNAMPD
ncbi:MAG: S41 family peptidase [Mangrovibacterium sp.]